MGWWVHACVLMGNHDHLLVEAPEANLVAGLKWFQGASAIRFATRLQMGDPSRVSRSCAAHPEKPSTVFTRQLRELEKMSIVVKPPSFILW
jgi:REP element-mobilizing transposase RayT